MSAIVKRMFIGNSGISQAKFIRQYYGEGQEFAIDRPTLLYTAELVQRVNSVVAEK